MYIYLRKVSTYKGYPCQHAHLTKTVSKSKDWGANSPLTVEVLEVDDFIEFTNIRIVDVVYRNKGGEAFQTIADINVNNKIYSILFDIRVRHLMDLIKSVGIGEKGLLPVDYSYIYSDNGIIPKKDGLPAYEEVKRELNKKTEISQKKEKLKDKKIPKNKLKNFHVYKSLNGEEFAILGVVSKATHDKKRYIMCLKKTPENLLTQEQLVQRVYKEQYFLEDNLDIVEELGEFVEEGLNLTFKELINLHNNNLQIFNTSNTSLSDKLNLYGKVYVTTFSTLANFYQEFINSPAIKPIVNIAYTQEENSVLTTLLNLNRGLFEHKLQNIQTMRESCITALRTVGTPDFDLFLSVFLVKLQDIIQSKYLAVSARDTEIDWVNYLDVETIYNSIIKIFKYTEGFYIYSITHDGKFLCANRDRFNSYNNRYQEMNLKYKNLIYTDFIKYANINM